MYSQLWQLREGIFCRICLLLKLQFALRAPGWCGEPPFFWHPTLCFVEADDQTWRVEMSVGGRFRCSSERCKSTLEFDETVGLLVSMSMRRWAPGYSWGLMQQISHKVCYLAVMNFIGADWRDMIHCWCKDFLCIWMVKKWKGLWQSVFERWPFLL